MRQRSSGAVTAIVGPRFAKKGCVPSHPGCRDQPRLQTSSNPENLPSSGERATGIEPAFSAWEADLAWICDLRHRSYLPADLPVQPTTDVTIRPPPTIDSRTVAHGARTGPAEQWRASHRSVTSRSPRASARSTSVRRRWFGTRVGFPQGHDHRHGSGARPMTGGPSLGAGWEA